MPLHILKQLRGLARTEGTTLYTLLLSAYYALLHRYTSQEDIIVGTPMAGRSTLEREDCVGFFVNTLPVRVNVGGNPSFRSLLARVKQRVMGALTHQVFGALCRLTQLC